MALRASVAAAGRAGPRSFKKVLPAPSWQPPIIRFFSEPFCPDKIFGWSTHLDPEPTTEYATFFGIDVSLYGCYCALQCGCNTAFSEATSPCL